MDIWYFPINMVKKQEFFSPLTCFELRFYFSCQEFYLQSRQMWSLKHSFQPASQRVPVSTPGNKQTQEKGRAGGAANPGQSSDICCTLRALQLLCLCFWRAWAESCCLWVHGSIANDVQDHCGQPFSKSKRNTLSASFFFPELVAISHNGKYHPIY